jgi:zinc/manganese transport system substrate-binding protein
MAMTWRRVVAAAAATAAALAGAGCGSTTGAGGKGKIAIVAAENQYGNVAAQIGGAYVSVYSVESNPNTDPHSYEATPNVAQQIASAQLLIENGLGYDGFMGKLASASPSGTRRVIDVQHLLGLPDSTPNPHLWYDPATMPAVARAIAHDLSEIDPRHAAAFRANEIKFVKSLRPWLTAIAAFKAAHRGVTAATTEPVADDLLAAMGIDNLSPFGFQADVMNGTDPSPQAVSLVQSLLTSHKVQLFAYNAQVTDPLTDSIRQTAVRAGVPVVALYETMPSSAHDYQSWMLAEVRAITNAVVDHTSTSHL